MIKVDVISDDNSWSKRIRNQKIFFNQICNHFPDKYKFKYKKITFSLLLSNHKVIKKLNFKFIKKNKSTDILSFPIENSKKLKPNSYLGDIIINFEAINNPKKQTNNDFKNKVIKIFIHGFLHLLGFNHTKLKDFKKMAKEEAKIYKAVIKKMS